MEFLQAIKHLDNSKVLRFGFAVDPNYMPEDIWNPRPQLTPNIDRSYVDFIIVDKNKIPQITKDLFPQYPAGFNLLTCDYNTMVHKQLTHEYNIDGAICGVVKHNGKTMFINEKQRDEVNGVIDQQPILFKMVKQFLQSK